MLKTTWALDVPPRIRFCGWKVGVSELATKDNIARRIPQFGMCYDICGKLEDFGNLALFECPLAMEIWRQSEFEEQLRRKCPHSAID